MPGCARMPATWLSAGSTGWGHSLSSFNVPLDASLAGEVPGVRRGSGRSVAGRCSSRPPTVSDHTSASSMTVEPLVRAVMTNWLAVGEKVAAHIASLACHSTPRPLRAGTRALPLSSRVRTEVRDNCPVAVAVLAIGRGEAETGIQTGDCRGKKSKIGSCLSSPISRVRGETCFCCLGGRDERTT